MRTIKITTPRIGWENPGVIKHNSARVAYDDQLDIHVALKSVRTRFARQYMPAGATRFEIFQSEVTWFEDAVLVDRETNTEAGNLPADVRIELV